MHALQNRAVGGSGLLFAVIGNVEHGDQRGRQIGFPTINLPIEQDGRLDGVWAGCVDLRHGRHLAAISVGNRPTFYGRDGYRLLEAHLLDFNGDLYGELVVVWMCKWLRAQQRFASVDELVRQLTSDVHATQQWSVRDRATVEPTRAGVPHLGQVIRVANAA